MNPTYVLIDFENVQPKDIALLKDGNYLIQVFLGPNQAKIPLNIVTALQPLGDKVNYIAIPSSGHNALDLLITYYLGYFIRNDPKASFCIISKDKDYTLLINHLKEKNLAVSRHETIASMLGKGSSSSPVVAHKLVPKPQIPPAAKVKAKAGTKPKTPKSNAAIVGTQPTSEEQIAIQDLIKRKKALPRTMKTLTSTFTAIYKNLSEEEIHSLCKSLEKRGIIKSDGKKIDYNLPAKS